MIGIAGRALLLRAGLPQGIGGEGFAFFHGDAERGEALVFAGIDLGALGDQGVDHVGAAGLGGVMEGGPAVLVLGVDVSAGVDQGLDDRELPGVGGLVERGLLVFLAGVDVRAALDEGLGDVGLAAGGGEVERGFDVLIGRVGVRAVGEEEIDGGLVAARDGLSGVLLSLFWALTFGVEARAAWRSAVVPFIAATWSGVLPPGGPLSAFEQPMLVTRRTVARTGTRRADAVMKNSFQE
jgi:hypothetical protein